MSTNKTRILKYLGSHSFTEKKLLLILNSKIPLLLKTRILDKTSFFRNITITALSSVKKLRVFYLPCLEMRLK